jgi:hypothetical protein
MSAYRLSLTTSGPPPPSTRPNSRQPASRVMPCVTRPTYPCCPSPRKTSCGRINRSIPPFGSYLATPPERVIRVHKTSGTTGRALYLALTDRDRRMMNEGAARALWAAGLRPSDTVVHCLNYRPWAGGYSDHENLETTGATVVPYGVGQTASLIQTIRDLADQRHQRDSLVHAAACRSGARPGDPSG